MQPLVRMRTVPIGLSFAAIILAGPAAGAPQAVDFVDLSIEELANIVVSSISKKEERLDGAAAAIYVITGDAIRRAGARSLPEALRLAPNLQVARINGTQYAISARGFNASTANKLLVMIDGRAVYTPLYSGVFWDAQDSWLDDVERIEVVSGPGGTVWGTNAVNGVINVITKAAAKTAGSALHAWGGDGDRGLALRHGQAEPGSAWRLYAKTEHLERAERASGAAVPDGTRRSLAGFRADVTHPAGALSAMGELYRASEEMATANRTTLSGAHLLLRWDGVPADGRQWRLQAFLDHTARDIPASFNEKLDTADLDLQYAIDQAQGRSWLLGGGYRLARDKVVNGTTFAFLPPQRTLHWGNLYAQHERPLTGAVRLTAGLRLETNDYTGMEWLPSVKLAMPVDGDGMLWLGLARVVRAPSRIDVDFYYPSTPPYVLAGGPNFRSEIANTVDLGWRARHGSTVSYALVAYASRYRHLRSLSKLPSGESVLDNRIAATVMGLEAWSSWTLGKSLTVDLSGNVMHQRLDGPVSTARPGNDPRRQLRLGVRWHIDESKEVQAALRHVGALPAPAAPSSTMLDLHASWQLHPAWSLSLHADNVLDRRQVEFPATSSAIPIVWGRRLGLDLRARF